MAENITSSPANPELAAGTVRIIKIAEESAVIKHRWKDRGLSPRGYIKGMTLVYARVFCKLKAGDAAALEMAKAKSGDSSKDALSWYNDKFAAIGVSNDQDGIDTLRNLFVLLIGLGMRESSGQHCVGRDRSTSNTTSETAEAGLFQASFNARKASPLMQELFERYRHRPTGFLEVFREGVRCKAKDLENFGAGDGKLFQQLSKECPAFAAEFAVVGLRNSRKHWGPINRREVEVLPACADMLRRVEETIDAFGLCTVVTA